MKSGIYSITSDRGFYIGSAIDLGKRRRLHLFYLRHNKHGNLRLQRIWNKYGESSFVFRPLFLCDPENLLFYEQKAIDYFWCKDNFLNVCPVAGSTFGTMRTQETRRKMSKSSMGKPCSEETKLKLRLINLGKTLPDSTREKMSIRMLGNKYAVGCHAHRGRLLSIETKQKIADTLRRKGIVPPWIKKNIVNQEGVSAIQA